MRRGLLVATLLIMAGTEAMACGDKFVVVGRGAGLERGFASKYPAAILLYANAPSVERRDLRARLKMAGHSIHRVADDTALASALQTGRYDILLADIRDSASIEERIRNVSTVFLPVVQSPSSSDLAAAKAAYGCALRGDRKPQDFLVTIDEVMAQKAKQVRQPVCDITQ